MQDAEQLHQRVLVCCHLPLCPETCPPPCLLWNYLDVLDILRGTTCVVATMAGHTHQNGYVHDQVRRTRWPQLLASPDTCMSGWRGLNPSLPAPPPLSAFCS